VNGPVPSVPRARSLRFAVPLAHTIRTSTAPVSRKPYGLARLIVTVPAVSSARTVKSVFGSELPIIVDRLAGFLMNSNVAAT